MNRNRRRSPPDRNTQVSPAMQTEQIRYPTPAVRYFPDARDERPKKSVCRVIIPVTLLVVAIIVAVVLCAHNTNGLPIATDPAPLVVGGGEPIPEEQGKPKDNDRSHLPGYDSLTFTAGKKEQNLVLQNPGENTCLIRFSLILEDGTTVYQSELVEPGYYTLPITLLKPLKQGVYEHATLKYECFTADEAHTPLNGATTKLDITVQ